MLETSTLPVSLCLTLIALLLVVCHCTTGGEPQLELQISPCKDGYVVGEPISLKYTLKNPSTEKIALQLSYPGLYVKFTCAKATPVRRDEGVYVNYTGTGPPPLELEPSAEYHRVLYLNRHLRFPGVGKYDVAFTAGHYTAETTVQLEPQFICKGSFIVNIVPGAFDESLLKAVYGRWDPADEQRCEEVLEGLSFVDDPVVMKYLVKYGRELPTHIGAAADGLKKFAGTPQGRAALEQLGAEFPRDEDFVAPRQRVRFPKENSYGTVALKDVLEIFKMTKNAPSQAFIEAQLSPQSEGSHRPYHALEFLLQTKNTKRVPIETVERFAKGNDKFDAEVAKKLLDLYRTQGDGN